MGISRRETLSAFVVLVAAFASSTLSAQERMQHVTTAQPSEARFEIVQSSLAFRWTFRLDRFTGFVEQLVTHKEEDGDEVFAWEVVTVQERPVISNPTRPRFQLFLSGIGARGTLLLDTQEGSSWVYTTITHRREDRTEYTTTEWVLLRRVP